MSNVTWGYPQGAPALSSNMQGWTCFFFILELVGVYPAEKTKSPAIEAHSRAVLKQV